MTEKNAEENVDYRYNDICPHCGAKAGTPVCPECRKCNGLTQVFSRVTGFYRPVRNYNKGKIAEYRDRKNYVLK